MRMLFVASAVFFAGCNMSGMTVETPTPSFSPGTFGPSEASILSVQGPTTGKVGQPITLVVFVEFANTGLDIGRLDAELDSKTKTITISGTEVQTSSMPQPLVVTKKSEVQFTPPETGTYSVVVKSLRYSGGTKTALTITVTE